MTKSRLPSNKKSKTKSKKSKTLTKSKVPAGGADCPVPPEQTAEIIIPDKKPAIKLPTMDKLFSTIIKQKQTTALIDLNKIRKYYHKTLTHLKKYNQDKLNALNETMSSHKIDPVKMNTLLNIFNTITNPPKKPIKKMTLRRVKPLKKGEHKCFPGYNISIRKTQSYNIVPRYT